MRYPILALISIGNLKILNCVSQLRGWCPVKYKRTQIKQNVLNLKSTLDGPIKTLQGKGKTLRLNIVLFEFTQKLRLGEYLMKKDTSKKDRTTNKGRKYLLQRQFNNFYYYCNICFSVIFSVVKQSFFKPSKNRNRAVVSK